jgi:stage III sporulation protein AE
VQTAEQEWLRTLVEQQMENVNTQPMDDAWAELRRQYDAYLLPDAERTWMTWWLPGSGQSFDLLAMLKQVALYFFDEIVVHGELLTMLVVLALFAALIDRLQSAFASEQVARIAAMFMLVLLMSVATHSLYQSLSFAKEAVMRMSDFMLAMFPLFLSLLAVTGNFVSMMSVQPLLMLMTQSMAALIEHVVFPLFFFAALLYMASALNEHYKVTRMAQLLTHIGMTLLGVLFTAFLGVLSIQGAFAAVADGLAMRAAKFVVGNFVPVVGRMFADAADTVFSASLIVKNGVGFIGLITIFLICVFPAIKILVVAVIYRVCAALLQPLGDSPLSACLEAIGKCMMLIFGAVASLGLMFFLSLTVLIGMGNATLMFR